MTSPTLPRHHHLPEFSGDVQPALRNAPSRPCLSTALGCCPMSLSSQAEHSANEQVAYLSHQAVSHHASHVTEYPMAAVSHPASQARTFVAEAPVSLPARQAKDLVRAEAVSFLASQLTDFGGVQVATSVGHAQDTWVAFQVSFPAPGDPCGIPLPCQEIDISSDCSHCRSRCLADLFLFALSSLSHLLVGASSSCAKRLEDLLLSQKEKGVKIFEADIGAVFYAK